MRNWAGTPSPVSGPDRPLAQALALGDVLEPDGLERLVRARTVESTAVLPASSRPPRASAGSVRYPPRAVRLRKDWRRTPNRCVIRRRNLTPSIKGSQRVSVPIGVEPARRITPLAERAIRLLDQQCKGGGEFAWAQRVVRGNGVGIGHGQNARLLEFCGLSSRASGLRPAGSGRSSSSGVHA